MRGRGAKTESRRRRILIYGYNRVNLGDDLFFKILVERYPDVDFYMMAEVDYEKIIVRPNFYCIRRNRINKIFSSHIPYQFYFYRFDAVVCIGGSIFMEAGESGSCNFVRFLLKYKRRFPGVPIHIIGSNYGPERTSAFRESERGVFAFVDSVCLRDRYSYALFKENSRVACAPDVIFQLGAEHRTRKSENVVGISVIDLPSRAQLQEYAEQYEAFLMHHIERSIVAGKRVRLFSFCDYERDNEACNRLLAKVCDEWRERIEVVSYKGDIDGFLESFSSVELLLASRFHAVVLGLMYRIPTIPVVYSDKTIHILNDIEYGGDIVDIRNIGDLSRELKTELLEEDFVKRLGLSAQIHFCGVDTMLSD